MVYMVSDAVRDAATHDAARHVLFDVWAWTSEKEYECVNWNGETTWERSFGQGLRLAVHRHFFSRVSLPFPFLSSSPFLLPSPPEGPPSKPARCSGKALWAPSIFRAEPDCQTLYGTIWTKSRAFGDTKSTIYKHLGLLVSQLEFWIRRHIVISNSSMENSDNYFG